MQATTWIRPESLSLLDVGCNVGAFLKTCQQAMPRLKLAGVEINETALAIAQRQLPGIDLHHDYGQASYRICVVLQKLDTVESREDAENA